MKRSGILLVVMLAIGCARTYAPPKITAAPATAAQKAPAKAPISEPPRAAFIGEGSLEAHGESTAKTKLALEHLGITAVTTGDVAEMTIEHEFRNDADEQLEGTFRFPLPDGAMLTGLSMEIDALRRVRYGRDEPPPVSIGARTVASSARRWPVVISKTIGSLRSRSTVRKMSSSAPIRRA